MSLASSIDRRYSTPSAKVGYRRLTSTTAQNVARYIPNEDGAISLNWQFGQGVGGGSVTFRGLPFEPAIKDYIEIHLGYDGQVLPRFTGFVTDPGRESFPKTRTVQVRDVLWLADFVVEQGGGTVVYDSNGDPLTVQSDAIVLIGPGGTPNDILANEVILRLLRDWAGIPEFRIKVPPLEQSPGVPWVLGHLSPLSWSNVSPLQICQQICDVLGYWLFADAQGYVRAVQMSGAPSTTAWKSYIQGQNLPVPGPSSSSSVDQVYNRAVVTGANTLLIPSASGTGPAAALPVTDSWRVDNTLLPPGKNRTLPYQNGFIEYVTRAQAGEASAEAVAQRLVSQHGREPFTVSVPDVKADPRLSVGQTVALQAGRIGVPTRRNFFVYGINETFGGSKYRQALTLDGGTGLEGYTENPPPDASFTYTLMLETLNGVDMVEIFCTAPEATAAGPLMAWNWTALGGTPATGTTRLWMTMFPFSQGSADITLTVTDLLGKISDPFTLTITFPSRAEVPQRKISFAAGNTWYITPNGGRVWRHESGQPSIAVPPIGAGGYDGATSDDTDAGALSTRTSGVRVTKDMLATASTALSGLPATPLFLWQNEANPLRVWAAVGNDVYFSANGGTTFVKAGTPPVPSSETDKTVRWIVEAFDNLNVIDVLAGRYAYTSFDGGKNWTEQLVGPADSVAKAYVSGQGKHWVAYTGVTAGSAPVRSFEGDSIAWPPATSPMVTDVRAITMMVETPDLYMFDGQGRIWKANAVDGSGLTLWGNMPNV